VKEALRQLIGIDAEGIKEVFSQAQECLQEVLSRWRGRYPKLADMFEGKDNLFSYFAFPAPTRRSLDANNPTESLNKRLERVTRSNSFTKRSGVRNFFRVQHKMGRAQTP